MRKKRDDHGDVHVELDPKEARSAEKGRSIKWVLYISTAGAVIGLLLVWTFAV